MEHLKYRPDIDGLRAIAVLSVVIFHYFPSLLPGGFVGVDIFFVISGYLITSIILKSASNKSFSYLDFYKRRVLRIFPALSIVLVSCLIVGWIYLFQDDYKLLGKHV
ncbi:acyltransferase family protein, partial [Salmonella enterica subsp. enterica serovar Typhi]|nr:acyltransferase family protein [Salmonella enterica subsp. enterica serovar Typhi]